MKPRSQPPIFIDTCALSDKGFNWWVKEYIGSKSISSVVYMEYSLYCYGKGQDQNLVDKKIRSMGITITPFNKEQAKKAAEIMMGMDRDRRCESCGNINWNDVMIAADTPCAPTILVTKNIKDFEPLIDWKGRLKTPMELMRAG